jgi:hypothetical protein
VTGQQRRRPAVPVRSDAARQTETLHDRLDAIAELHRAGVTGFCPACLLDGPCPTYRLATGVES